ncbi:MAG TPA: hypothetical protein VMT47_09615 [Polyangia bacterium]|nr:hypothetical protein [Polyangia bacterium]
MRRPIASLPTVVAAGLTLVAAAALAQEPPVAPAAQPGVRIVAGQSAIIGGNGAGARDRALEEAFRQAIDQSLAELLDAATRAGQARAIRALEARARTYVRRYRALEEGEANGAYSVRLEVEVDEPALQRAVESWGQSAQRSPPPSAIVSGILLVSNGAPEATSLLLSALVAAGARAQLAEPAVKEVADAQRAAARANLPQVAIVSGQAASEGPVRGTGKVSVSCRIAARLISAPSGLAVGEPDAAPRAFAADEGVARTECLTRAAGDVAARLAPTGGATIAPGGDLRTVTVEADVVEPAAVAALLKDVRSVGSVSSAELRRIESGHAEIRARTRALAMALAPALSRDAALVLSNVEVSGDVIRLRARLRPLTTP